MSTRDTSRSTSSLCAADKRATSSRAACPCALQQLCDLVGRDVDDLTAVLGALHRRVLLQRLLHRVVADERLHTSKEGRDRAGVRRMQG